MTALPINERIKTTDDNNEYLSDTTCFDNYGKGWKLIWSSFGVLFAVTLIYLAFRVPTDIMDDLARAGVEVPGWLLISLVPFAIFVLGPITMSYGWVFLKAVRYEEHRICDVFAVFKRNYWNAVGGGLLKFVLVAIGFVLFTVPGIYLLCRLAFVEYLIIDRKMNVGDAIESSWAMTKGHGWTICGMIFLSIPLVIAGLLAFIIGMVVAVMWMSAAMAVLYHSVCVTEGIPVTKGAAPAIAA